MKSFKKLLGVVVALVLCVAMTIPTMAAPAEGFTDVEDGAWYESAVERWTDAGLIKGYEDGSFGTDGNITRAEVATVVQRLLDLKTPDDPAKVFTDVTTADWFYDYVMACANSEPAMLNGYGATFGPNDPIKREDAFKILVTALVDESAMVAEADIDATLANFADAASVDSWADEHVATLVKMGILTGYNNNGVYTLKPTQNITRAEFATILNRLIAIYVYVDADTGETVVSEYAAPASEPDVEIDASQNTSVVLVVNAEENDIVVEVKTVEDAATGETKDVVVVSKVVEDAATGETVKEELASADVADEEEVLVVSTTTTTTDENTTVGKLPVQKDETIVVTPEITYVDEYDNCAAGGARYEVTTVGAEVTKEFMKDLPAKVHNMVDGVCKDCGMKAADAMKFNLKVSSVCEEETNYVEANVTNDYAATLTVTPGKVSASNVTLAVKMQDVDSLGVADKVKSHEQTFTTDMNGDPELAFWLSNVFEFEKGYIDVTISDDYHTVYTVEGNKPAEGVAAVITATPSDVQDTRDAWQEMTSHITTTEQTDSDSYVTIANGSYMIIGADKLCFEKGDAVGDLTLDNFSDIDGVKTEIRNKVQLLTDVYEGSDEAVFYLAAGTKLAVSNSIATLDDNCTITVDADALKEVPEYNTILQDLRAAESTYDMATKLVQLVNILVGAANDETMYVDISFEEPVEKATKFYFGVTADNTAGGTTTVDMEVFDDYSLEINLPMDELKANNVTLEVAMNNVGSLGEDGTKSHKATYSTGIDATGDLAFWMDNAPDFETATINATIIGLDETAKSCTYTLVGDQDEDWVTVTGTTDTDAARAAWQLLTNDDHIVTYDNPKGDDSYIEIAKNSSLLLGKEYLAFEKDVDNLVLDNFSDLAAVKQNIKDHVVLTTIEESGVEVFIGAGTKLAVSSSVAELVANATITIEVTDANGNPVSFADSTALSEIRENADSTYDLVQSLFTMLNDVVGEMNNATADVTIEFNKPIIVE